MGISEINNSTILFAALDWGFGHVSRSISILLQLETQNNKLIIACDDVQKAIFTNYFPNAVYEQLEGYAIHFGGKGNFASDLWRNRKRLLKSIRSENLKVELWRKKHAIDIVISDHRYGFFSKKNSSIFITHQLHLPLQWYQFMAQWIHEKLLSSFNTLWIPDYEDSKLAGKLSRPIKHKNIQYIGPQSRFLLKNSRPLIPCEKVFLISGPTPYDEQFLEFCLKENENTKEGNIFICSPHLLSKFNLSSVKCVPSDNWPTVDSYIRGCEHLVSRSGYTTIMDAHILKKKTTFYPTIGQAEQIYLAKIHS